MIDVRGLSYTYAGATTPAVADVTFRVERGEIFGFLGPSGAGKSTTQKILIGLLRDYDGEVKVLGRDANRWQPGDYARIGVSFELPNHYLRLTAMENLRLFRALHGGRGDDPRARPMDLRNIRRDPLLAWVGLMPFALALFFRLTPRLRDLLMARFAFDLEPYYPLIASAFVTSAPGIVGMVVGFLLLDERDERVLDAIAVTPVALRTYVLYRVTAPLVLGSVMTIIAYPILALTPLRFIDLLFVAAVASLLAPITALFLAAFAQNKISGFAMVKVLNVLGIAPVAAWFVPEPAQWLAGIVPSYWPMKMVWRAAAGEPYGGHVIAGVAVSVVALFLLQRTFRRHQST